MFVLRAPEVDEGEEHDWEADSDHPTGAPAAMVIAETQAAVKTMTVSMAVMELDLTAYPAIVFRNAAHGGLSVVYRRPDGNIGWIDPERTKSLNGTRVNRELNRHPVMVGGAVGGLTATAPRRSTTSER
jgi:hypothetical protein